MILATKRSLHVLIYINYVTYLGGFIRSTFHLTTLSIMSVWLELVATVSLQIARLYEVSYLVVPSLFLRCDSTSRFRTDGVNEQVINCSQPSFPSCRNSFALLPWRFNLASTQWFESEEFLWINTNRYLYWSLRQYWSGRKNTTGHRYKGKAHLIPRRTNKFAWLGYLFFAYSAKYIPA